MYTTDELENLDPEEKERRKHSIQMQMAVLDSDTVKLQNEKKALEVEMRQVEREEARQRVILKEKKDQYEKVIYQITQNEEEMKKMKKKLNVL